MLANLTDKVSYYRIKDLRFDLHLLQN